MSTLYTFNGELMTIAAIRKLVPCISDAGLRDAIKAGRNTTQLITQYRRAPRKPSPGSNLVINFRRLP